MYDENDLKASHTAGFIQGAASGVILTFLLCLAVGFYFNL